MALLGLIYLAFISLGLPDSLLGSAWPLLYRDLGVPLSYAGGISMIISLGTVASSLLSGRLMRRFPTGVIAVVSVAMTAAALLGFSGAKHFAALCLLAVPLGLGAGAVDAALNHHVALHYKARHMNWLHCFWGLGASGGPLILSAWLREGRSWRMGYESVGILQVCLVILLFSSLKLWKGGEEETAGGKAPRLGEILRQPGVKPTLAGFFCYCTVESTAGLWGAAYLVMEKGIHPERAASWVALYYVGITFGRFLSGFVSFRLSCRQLVRLGQGILFAGILLLLLPFGDTAALAGLFAIGLGCAPIFPNLLQETPETFGPDLSQGVIGLEMAGAYAGTTLMPPLFGCLASWTGYGLLPLFLAAALAVSVGTTEQVNRQTRRKNN